MARVIVNLNENEWQALREQAERDFRGSRDEARHLIVRGLDADLAQSVIMDCDHCKFWYITENQLGECRKNSPTPYNVSETDEETRLAFWPETDSKDWCGEFSEKISNAEGQSEQENLSGH